MAVEYLGCRLKCDRCHYCPEGVFTQSEKARGQLKKVGWEVGLANGIFPWKLSDYCPDCSASVDIQESLRSGYLNRTAPEKWL